MGEQIGGFQQLGTGLEMWEEGGCGNKREIGGILMVMELFCISTMVMHTKTYT